MLVAPTEVAGVGRTLNLGSCGESLPGHAKRLIKRYHSGLETRRGQTVVPRHGIPSRPTQAVAVGFPPVVPGESFGALSLWRPSPRVLSVGRRLRGQTRLSSSHFLSTGRFPLPIGLRRPGLDKSLPLSPGLSTTNPR
ncbi:hypothetical protein R1flu_021130 [Riccia fluitans]|uniref:Uncharacterized protein n=1 Tax=Riccia fluitans TaxID=41844 RepID=A0ABD1ZPN4_9MARC